MRMLLATLAALLVGVPLAASPSPAPSRLGPTERIPNKDFKNAYPRWLGYTSLGTTTPPGGFEQQIQQPSISVSMRNHAHIAAAIYPYSIVHMSNLYQSRKENGFSEPYYVEQINPNAQPGVTVGNPDIWADDDDVIHVVWEHYVQNFADSSGDTDKDDIYYRKKTAIGWGPIINLSQANPGQFYWAPQITVEVNGHVHISSRFEDRSVLPQPIIQSVKYLHMPLGSTTAAKEDLSDATLVTIGVIPRIAINHTVSPAIPYIVWEELTGDFNNPNQVYYSKRSGGWTAKQPLAQPGFNYAPDVSVDPSNVAHFAWSKKKPDPTGGFLFGYDSVYYSSTAEPNENLVNGPSKNDGSDIYDRVRILADSRGQPNIMWRGLRYAKRVKNPNPFTLNSTWFKQDMIVVPNGPKNPGDFTMGSPYEAAISKGDQIHVVDFNNYTRTMEYGVGSGDEQAHIRLFPGGSLDVSDGNMMCGIPLFGTKGVGPCQSMNLTYNSLEPYSGLVAPGWHLNYEMYLIAHNIDPSKPPTATVFFQDGRAAFFEQPTGLSILADQVEYGYSCRLDKMNFGWKMTSAHGTEYNFDDKGKLMSIVEATGNYILLIYDDFGRLTQVRDMLGNGGGGRTTFLFYDVGDEVNGNRITSITDPGGKQYALGYSLLAGLATVRFASGPGQPTYGMDYYLADDILNGGRMNLLARFQTPRGHAGNYGWTCSYFPDGRLWKVSDPSEVYLQDGDPDGSVPTAQSATRTITYTETLAVGSVRETVMVDPRGAMTVYQVEPRRGLALSIYDQAALNQVPGISPVIRVFDDTGNLRELTDRWGHTTFYDYFVPTGQTPYVRLLVNNVYKPSTSGSGVELVESFSHTLDIFNNLQTHTTYATPPGGGGAVARVTTNMYDSVGRLITVNHPNVTRPDGTTQSGVTTTYEYGGPRGALSKETNEELHATTYSQWDSVHGLPQAVLRDGGLQPEMIHYDANGNVTETLQPQGGPGNEVPGWNQFGLDGMYRIATITDPAGKVTTYGYDLDSNLVSIQPPLGLPTTKVYDRRGYLSSTTTPDGTSYQWVDANGNVRRTRSQRGFETNLDYDILNRVVETRVPGASTTPSGGGGPMMVTRTDNDVFQGGGRIRTVTEVGSPSNRVTKTIFDNRGREKTVIKPDGLTVVNNYYDEQDHVVATERYYNGSLVTCMITYRDARDRVDHVRVQDAAFGQTPVHQSDSYTIYNKVGTSIQTIDPLGSPTAGGYAHKITRLVDARERVELVVDGLGQIVEQNIYGDDDLLAERRVPDPETKSVLMVTREKRTYTARKELKTTTNFSGVGLTNTYTDVQGQIDTVTDALGRVTKTFYDPNTRRVDQVAEAYQTPRERRTQTIWQNGLLAETRVWNFTTQAFDASYKRFYDQADRLERFEPPIVAAERFYYNEFSEQKQMVADTKVITHYYDTLGERTSSVWTGAFSASETRTFNGLGLVESVSNGLQSKVLLYDLWLGTPSVETLLVNGAIWKVQSHSYDANKNYVGFLDSENGLHQWVYDENNRVTAVKYQPQGGSSATVYEISYTVGGLVDTTSIRDASGALIAVTTHEYDKLGRKTRAETVQAGTASVLADFQWEFDSLDLVTKVTMGHLGVAADIGYNERRELTNESISGNGSGQTPPAFQNNIGGTPGGPESVPTPAAQGMRSSVLAVSARTAVYDIDPGGNRKSQTINQVTTTYLYNSANQLTDESAPGRTVQHFYDSWGNENLRTTQTGSTKTETYGYNYQNFLAAYTNSETGASWQYDFWPTGERYSKTNLSTSTSEIYANRAHDVATDYTHVSGGPIAYANSYVQGAGLDQKFSRVVAGGGRRHYIGNQVGTLSMTLTDTGTPAEIGLMDAWGNQVAGGTPSERYGFAQREHDTESGLVYMRARVYDPAIGRFTQTDPILENRAVENYHYASTNPVSKVDPTGEDWWTWKDVKQGFGESLRAFGRGFVEGAKSTVKGVVEVSKNVKDGAVAWVTDPKQAMEDLGVGVSGLKNAPGAIKAVAAKTIEEIKQDPTKVSEIAGRATFEVLTFVVADKGLSKISELKLVKEVEGLSELATISKAVNSAPTKVIEETVAELPRGAKAVMEFRTELNAAKEAYKATEGATGIAPQAVNGATLAATETKEGELILTLNKASMGGGKSADAIVQKAIEIEQKYGGRLLNTAKIAEEAGHAEKATTVLAEGLEDARVYASRPICEGCEKAIMDAKAIPASPLKPPKVPKPTKPPVVDPTTPP